MDTIAGAPSINLMLIGTSEYSPTSVSIDAVPLNVRLDPSLLLPKELFINLNSDISCSCPPELSVPFISIVALNCVVLEFDSSVLDGSDAKSHSPVVIHVLLSKSICRLVKPPSACSTIRFLNAELPSLVVVVFVRFPVTFCPNALVPNDWAVHMRLTLTAIIRILNVITLKYFWVFIAVAVKIVH